MGGRGSGRKPARVLESTLPRLDVFELVDRGVFRKDVVAGELEWPEHEIRLRFERSGNGLCVVAPFKQFIQTDTLRTPSGTYRLFRCGCESASKRRILYVLPRRIVCRVCGPPLAYRTEGASGSSKNKAIARYKSLKRGRRRPPGGMAAHEERLRHAKEDALLKIWSPGEALLRELWGVDDAYPDPFDEAIRAEWRAAFPKSDG